MQDGRVMAVRARRPTENSRFEADHVITTMPLATLVRALHPPAPEPERRGGRGAALPRFPGRRADARRENLFPDNWIYVHSPGVKVGRIQNFNNWSAAMVPEPGTTCLGMEYFCFEGDGLWTSPTRSWSRSRGGELEQLGLARASDVVDGTVIRMPKAYPIYDASYRDQLDEVRDSSTRSRTCTPSAATGCTSTTTRIIRCSRR